MQIMLQLFIVVKVMSFSDYIWKHSDMGIRNFSSVSCMLILQTSLSQIQIKRKFMHILWILKAWNFVHYSLKCSTKSSLIVRFISKHNQKQYLWKYTWIWDFLKIHAFFLDIELLRQFGKTQNSRTNCSEVDIKMLTKPVHTKY